MIEWSGGQEKKKDKKKVEKEERRKGGVRGSEEWSKREKAEE